MSRSAVIYCRISQDREGGGLGVERQRKDCEALVESLGWRVVAVEIDNDISAFSGKVRPGYRALLAALETGRADAVIAWHTDRLHRSNRELIDYIDMSMRLGVMTQTVKAGRIDLGTATGRATAITLGAWARRESEDKSERIVRKHEQSAELGKWRGGSRPFGYKPGGMELDEVEADLIREACRAVIDGRPLGEIIRDWNAKGVTTSTRSKLPNGERATTGKPWGYATLRQVLLRERNYGASIYRGKVAKLEAWEAIVDEGTWRSVRAVLSDPKRRLSTSNAGKWLLAGLGRCGKCEANEIVSVVRSATSQIKGVRYSIYRCQTGQHIARRADYTDNMVVGLVADRMSRPDIRDLLVPRSGVDRQALQHEARGLRARIDEAAGLFAEGVLTGSQLRTTTERLRERLQVVEDSMIDPSQSSVLVDLINASDFHTAWAALAWKARREALDALMTVTILPVPKGAPRRFSTDFFRFDWKVST